ncbi:hypothetical protein DUNSADRAFT_6317 [Dunaliella salina]|uniref:Uncharacterized protein n=1 Tax=Dunaliella salina TaxID=3046 RepID=A0ABQ7GNI8_DUNSA|nr:hypothetical protein DUNSADRAFT_6317 [Dunaliella salina]|eukprot:KAF5836165.1 hypothetical protein DUNSADRAFT_6317 [Dunaliella salina]
MHAIMDLCRLYSICGHLVSNNTNQNHESSFAKLLCWYYMAPIVFSVPHIHKMHPSTCACMHACVPQIVPAPPPPPSPEEIKRQQMKAEQIRSLCSSDTKILGQLDSGGQDGMLAAQGEPMEASMQTAALLAIRGGGADGSDLDIDLDDASAALAGVRARAAGEPPSVMKLVQGRALQSVLAGRQPGAMHAADAYALTLSCRLMHCPMLAPVPFHSLAVCVLALEALWACWLAANMIPNAQLKQESMGFNAATCYAHCRLLCPHTSCCLRACLAGAACVPALRACRLAANQIPNVQLQQESMGFIAELLRPLEVHLGVGEQQQDHQRLAQANGAGGSSGLDVGSSAKSMDQLLFDVHDLQQQLQEWAGLCH